MQSDKQVEILLTKLQDRWDQRDWLHVLQNLAAFVTEQDDNEIFFHLDGITMLHNVIRATDNSHIHAVVSYILASLSVKPAFTSSLINKGGLPLLLDMAQEKRCDLVTLGHTLRALSNLMFHYSDCRESISSSPALDTIVATAFDPDPTEAGHECCFNAFRCICCLSATQGAVQHALLAAAPNLFHVLRTFILSNRSSSLACELAVSVFANLSASPDLYARARQHAPLERLLEIRGFPVLLRARSGPSQHGHASVDTPDAIAMYRPGVCAEAHRALLHLTRFVCTVHNISHRPVLVAVYVKDSLASKSQSEPRAVVDVILRRFGRPVVVSACSCVNVPTPASDPHTCELKAVVSPEASDLPETLPQARYLQLLHFRIAGGVCGGEGLFVNDVRGTLKVSDEPWRCCPSCDGHVSRFPSLATTDCPNPVARVYGENALALASSTFAMSIVSLNPHTQAGNIPWKAGLDAASDAVGVVSPSSALSQAPQQWSFSAAPRTPAFAPRARQSDDPPCRIVFAGSLVPTQSESAPDVSMSLQEVFGGAHVAVAHIGSPVCKTSLDPSADFSIPVSRLNMSIDGLRGYLDANNINPRRCVLNVADPHAADYGLEGLKVSMSSLLRVTGAETIIGCGRRLSSQRTGLLAIAHFKPPTNGPGIEIGFVSWTTYHDRKLRRRVRKEGKDALWSEDDVLSIDWPAVRKKFGIDLLIGLPSWGRRPSESNTSDVDLGSTPSVRMRMLSNVLLSRLGFDAVVGHAPGGLYPAEAVGGEHGQAMHVPMAPNSAHVGFEAGYSDVALDRVSGPAVDGRWWAGAGGLPDGSGENAKRLMPWENHEGSEWTQGGGREARSEGIATAVVGSDDLIPEGVHHGTVATNTGVSANVGLGPRLDSLEGSGAATGSSSAVAATHSGGNMRARKPTPHSGARRRASLCCYGLGGLTCSSWRGGVGGVLVLDVAAAGGILKYQIIPVVHAFDGKRYSARLLSEAVADAALRHRVSCLIPSTHPSELAVMDMGATWDGGVGRCVFPPGTCVLQVEGNLRERTKLALSVIGEGGVNSSWFVCSLRARGTTSSRRSGEGVRRFTAFVCLAGDVECDEMDETTAVLARAIVERIGRLQGIVGLRLRALPDTLQKIHCISMCALPSRGIEETRTEAIFSDDDIRGWEGEKGFFCEVRGKAGRVASKDSSSTGGDDEDSRWGVMREVETGLAEVALPLRSRLQKVLTLPYEGPYRIPWAVEIDDDPTFETVAARPRDPSHHLPDKPPRDSLSNTKSRRTGGLDSGVLFDAASSGPDSCLEASKWTAESVLRKRWEGFLDRLQHSVSLLEEAMELLHNVYLDFMLRKKGDGPVTYTQTIAHVGSENGAVSSLSPQSSHSSPSKSRLSFRGSFRIKQSTAELQVGEREIAEISKWAESDLKTAVEELQRLFKLLNDANGVVGDQQFLATLLFAIRGVQSSLSTLGPGVVATLRGTLQLLQFGVFSPPAAKVCADVSPFFDAVTALPLAVGVLVRECQDARQEELECSEVNGDVDGDVDAACSSSEVQQCLECFDAIVDTWIDAGVLRILRRILGDTLASTDAVDISAVEETTGVDVLDIIRARACDVVSLLGCRPRSNSHLSTSLVLNGLHELVSKNSPAVCKSSRRALNTLEKNVVIVHNTTNLPVFVALYIKARFATKQVVDARASNRDSNLTMIGETVGSPAPKPTSAASLGLLSPQSLDVAAGAEVGAPPMHLAITHGYTLRRFGYVLRVPPDTCQRIPIPPVYSSSGSDPLDISERGALWHVRSPRKLVLTLEGSLLGRVLPRRAYKELLRKRVGSSVRSCADEIYVVHTGSQVKLASPLFRTCAYCMEELGVHNGFFDESASASPRSGETTKHVKSLKRKKSLSLSRKRSVSDSGKTTRSWFSPKRSSETERKMDVGRPGQKGQGVASGVDVGTTANMMGSREDNSRRRRARSHARLVGWDSTQGSARASSGNVRPGSATVACFGLVDEGDVVVDSTPATTTFDDAFLSTTEYELDRPLDPDQATCHRVPDVPYPRGGSSVPSALTPYDWWSVPGGCPFGGVPWGGTRYSWPRSPAVICNTPMKADLRRMAGREETAVEYRILLCGDVSICRAELTPIFSAAVTDRAARADLVVMNIESPVCHLGRDEGLEPGLRPSLDCSVDFVESLFSSLGSSPERCVCSVANNHAADYFGYDSLRTTVTNLSRLVGRGVVGATRRVGDIAMGKSPMVYTRTLQPANGGTPITIGIVAWTSFLNTRGSLEDTSIVWREDDVMGVDWPRLKKREAIHILIGFPHWEYSHSDIPHPHTRRLRRLLLNRGGFDVIAGHGSHGIQPVEISQRGTARGYDICAYSLGDLTPSRDARSTRPSAMLEIGISGEGELVSYEIVPLFHRPPSADEPAMVLPVSTAVRVCPEFREETTAAERMLGRLLHFGTMGSIPDAVRAAQIVCVYSVVISVPPSFAPKGCDIRIVVTLHGQITGHTHRMQGRVSGGSEYNPAWVAEKSHLGDLKEVELEVYNDSHCGRYPCVLSVGEVIVTEAVHAAPGDTFDPRQTRVWTFRGGDGMEVVPGGTAAVNLKNPSRSAIRLPPFFSGRG